MNRLLSIFCRILISGSLVSAAVNAAPPAGPPDHWSFRPNTGNSATIVIPAAIQPAIGSQLLQQGDFIGTFTPDGLCAGWIEWQNANAALTVWGDDDQTPELDGFRSGEQINYRIFQKSTQREFTEVTAEYEQGDGTYANNAILVLSQLEVPDPVTPILFVPRDTLDFAPGINSLSFPIENHGGGELAWEATAAPEKPWLINIEPDNGSGDAEVTINVDHQLLAVTADMTEIHIASNGGFGKIVVLIRKSSELPPHWEYPRNTGNNATVILPAEIDPTIEEQPLQMNDYVGVFTPGGMCCGWSQWNAENMAITIWGDNDQTPEIDGFQTGEELHYRVYRNSIAHEWTNIAVDYSQGNGYYSTNTIYILSQFQTEVTETPVLYVQPDTLDFGTSFDTLNFVIENHGNGELNWSLSSMFEKDWLADIYPRGGTNEADVQVFVNREQLVALVDTEKISITSNGGNGEVLVFIEKRTVDLPDHWKFKPSTGNNATVVLPVDANPNIGGEPLLAGDCIGVFTPANLCCGWVAWNQANAAITVWGDNNQTPEIDGFQAQEQLYYRVYRPSNAEEWTSVQVAYSQGTGLYETNQFMVLNQFDVITTSVAEIENEQQPQAVRLYQNYPNPFNAHTTIRYETSVSANVAITITDIRGAVVRQWNFQNQEAGSYQLIWDGKDLNDDYVASGIYLCRLSVRSNTQIIRKLTFLK